MLSNIAWEYPLRSKSIIWKSPRNRVRFITQETRASQKRKKKRNYKRFTGQTGIMIENVLC